MIQDTIAAIATPPVAAAIGIVRVSGDQVRTVIQTVFPSLKSFPTPRVMNVASLIDPLSEEIIDECCFAFFEGPRSYTGYDMLEIYCHGSPYICQKVVQIIVAMSGCRLAKNGEFTQQAFVNGKVSLTKAESILDVIESNSQKSHEIALNQYKGAVYNAITSTRDLLMTILQQVEASLEFPDDVGGVDLSSVHTIFQQLLTSLSQISSNSDYGQKVKEGVRYLILGQPNVGKSSLMNCISGENRSIVSNIAGTTRDYIDISIEYKGVLITIIDTAGIRSTDNEIESLGIDKIKELSSQVDGYILVEDVNQTESFELPSFIQSNKPMIRVINKIDTASSSNQNSKYIYTSCKTLDGINHLKQSLVDQFIQLDKFESDMILCNVRQIASLKEAHQCVNRAYSHLQNGATLDVVSIEIRDAIHQLSNILGDDFTEELLDGIFSKFCIGK